MTSDIDRLASRLNGNWRALLRARVNVLVTGPKKTLDDFMESCSKELRQPLVFSAPAAPLPLHSSPTLIITDVDHLDATAQRSLAAWLRDPANAATQIISLTSTPLFGLVNAGRFDRDLYYHLNMIHLRLIEASTVPLRQPRVA